MFWNAGASLLITGTTSALPFTGSVPPSTKQFCTSTTISAALGPGLIGSRPKALVRCRGQPRKAQNHDVAWQTSWWWDKQTLLRVESGSNPITAGAGSYVNHSES